MKIKLLESYKNYKKGSVIEIEERIANKLINNKIAKVSIREHLFKPFNFSFTKGFNKSPVEK